MKNIEVEIRSFITEDQYNELIDRFKKEAKFLGEDKQITYYFNCDEDLRIQKNDNFAKIWLKKGNIHDDQREEIEIKFGKEDFDKLEKLFLMINYDVEIKWFRNRHTFRLGDVDIMIDHTKGYGYTIELEKMSDEENKDKDLKYLKKKMSEFNIEVTPKEEFKEKYEYYKDNWEKLI